MEEVCYDSSTPLQVKSDPDQQQQQGAPVYCQVYGCGVLLTGGKTYCIKKRTCSEHIQAESVLLADDDTQLHRFCQQCGKFEPLNKFDGTKRSCRARLAKRRSGTRALLQKKGCKDTSGAASQGGAAGAAALQHSDTSGLTAEQQLMLIYGHHPDEALRQHLAAFSREAMAAAAAGACAPHSPQHTMPVSSVSDGAPMAAAAAATVAAAATHAAAAASHQALSAPLYMMGHGSFSAMQRQQQQVSAAARMAAAGMADEPMDQAEVLLALQVLEETSDPLPRLNASASSAAGYNPAAAAAAAAAATPAGPEHTSCSVPLAHLDLGGSRPAAATQQGPAASPENSMGGAPCQSAPLAGLPSSLLQCFGLPAQRTRSAEQHQQQQGNGRASRLKWLIQELQQELDVCNPAELDNLDNEELSTLLCAALAPASANPAAAAAAAAAAAGTRPGAGQQHPGAVPDSAAGALASLMGQVQTAQAAGGDQKPMPGFGAAQCMSPDLDLQVQKAQVMQLQHKVQQLQLQLQMTKDQGSSTPVQCATPPPPGAMRSVSAAAAAAAAAADISGVYRSLSCVSETLRAAGSGIPQGPLARLTFGGGSTASAAGQQLPGQHAPGQHAPGQHVPAGSMGAHAQGMAKAPGFGAAVPASMGMGAGWGAGNITQNGEAVLESMQQQQQLLRLQHAQQQQAALAGQAHGGMGAPDSAAAMQFMALQNQLKAVESEMLYLMAQQSAVAR